MKNKNYLHSMLCLSLLIAFPAYAESKSVGQWLDLFLAAPAPETARSSSTKPVVPVKPTPAIKPRTVQRIHTPTLPKKIAAGAYQPNKHSSYIRTTYLTATMEDGRRIAIFTDHNHRTNAYIDHPTGRKLLMPDGHYEIHRGSIYVLQSGNYQMTDDTSILLSIRQGKVINYYPKWAVDQGNFTPFIINNPAPATISPEKQGPPAPEKDEFEGVQIDK